MDCWHLCLSLSLGQFNPISSLAFSFHAKVKSDLLYSADISVGQFNPITFLAFSLQTYVNSDLHRSEQC
jgi:hypothetical protein